MHFILHDCTGWSIVWRRVDEGTRACSFSIARHDTRIKMQHIDIWNGLFFFELNPHSLQLLLHATFWTPSEHCTATQASTVLHANSWCCSAALDPLLFHFLIFWRLQQRVFGLKLIKNSMLMLQVQMCGCPRLICACDIGFNWECFFICVEERLKGVCIGVNFCSSVAKTLRYIFKIHFN